MARIAFSLIGVVIASCAGCGGPTSTVQGTVTIDGEIARQGTVVFHPVEGGAKAYGSIADNGSYALRVGQGDLNDPNAGDVPPGEYIITVVVNTPSSGRESLGEGDAGPPTPGPRLSAEKYATAETSDLKHTVKVGKNVFPLEIEGAKKEETAASESNAAESSTEISASSQPLPQAKRARAPRSKPSEDSRGKCLDDVGLRRNAAGRVRRLIRRFGKWNRYAQQLAADERDREVYTGSARSLRLRVNR